MIVPPESDVGTLPGSFSVDANGHAMHVVPLWAPDGRNGMSPKLALEYSSGAGDNAAGFGW
jgi:hypothetical protein